MRIAAERRSEPQRAVRHRVAAGTTALAVLLASFEARAECDRSTPWSRLGESAAHFVEPRPLVLTAVSAVPLAVFAPTGWDHELRVFAQVDLGGSYAQESVSLHAPYVLGGLLLASYGVTGAIGACEAQKPQAAMIQAMAVGLAVTGLLKWSVGRQWPNGGQDPYAPDRLSHPEYAQTFRPFQGGFGAWPSGHTLSMFAAASAFRASLPELGWPRFLGYPFALAVGAGMWLGDRHWASDVISGALLGEAIGSSVGQSFAHTDRRSGFEHGQLVATPAPGGGTLVLWVGTL